MHFLRKVYQWDINIDHTTNRNRMRFSYICCQTLTADSHNASRRMVLTWPQFMVWNSHVFCFFFAQTPWVFYGFLWPWTCGFNFITPNFCCLLWISLGFVSHGLEPCFLHWNWHLEGIPRFSAENAAYTICISLSLYIYIYMHSKFLCLPILSTYQPITNSISSGPPAIRGPGRKPHLRLQLPEGRRISTQCGRLLHVFIFLRAGDETVLWANTWWFKMI